MRVVIRTTMLFAVVTATLFAVVTFHCFTSSSGLTTDGSTTKRNVLLIMADDMRPDVGAYGAKHMVTPNLDRLATRSVVLRRAYVQQAVCSPSRTSMLTGRRPDTTHVHDLIHYWRHVAGNFTTLPEYFKQHGYKTAGIGKVCTVFCVCLQWLLRKSIFVCFFCAFSCKLQKVQFYLVAEWAHHHIRILYEFKFYVPHSTSDDVSSMFLVFLARTIRYL